MERALWALDCAVLVISGTEGFRVIPGRCGNCWSNRTYPAFSLSTRWTFLPAEKRADGGIAPGALRELCEYDRLAESGAYRGEKDALAMCDEELMEEYLKTGDFVVETLRKAVGGRSVFPASSGPP